MATRVGGAARRSVVEGGALRSRSGDDMTRLPILASTLLLGGALFAPGGARDDFPWLTDLEQANELARDSGRPMLVVFR